MPKSAKLPSAFAELGIETPLLRALGKAGFETPSDIQKKLIPLVLEGRDVLGQAKTGTGKTAAFGLPVLQMINPEGRLQSLILVPTRELAVQVAGELKRLSDGTTIHIVPVYGGQKIKHQLHLLGKKPHIVVGTPGRVMDLLGRRALTFDHIRFAILDEVDRMLDIGFRDDIREILSQIRTEHQTVFVSATFNDEIKKLARQYMQDPEDVNVSQDEITVANVKQTYLTVDPWDKFRLLMMILDREDPQLAIVFCNTKHAVRRLAKKLHDAGVDAKEIHGDLVQQKRERVMSRFRKHKLSVLVATDLAARGIDVQGITHIVNYDMPPDCEVYVHRIGRTARMGTFGKAISFVTREQGKELTNIEMLINQEIEQETVEGFTPRPPRDDFEASSPPGGGGGRGRSSFTPQPVATPAANEQKDDSDASTVKTGKPKRLGGKFKPKRRRR